MELAQHLDVHFISHWHGDHFSSTTSALLAELSDCLFVLPADCVDKAHEIGIPNERIHIVRPDEPFELPGGVSVRPHRALHGEKNFTVYRHASFDCGYLLEMGGKRIFQPGDTVLLEQHLDLNDIDVLFISLRCTICTSIAPQSSFTTWSLPSSSTSTSALTAKQKTICSGLGATPTN